MQDCEQHKARYVVPLAAAILVTFGRGGLMPIVSEKFTLFDLAMNYFLLLVAPVFALKFFLTNSPNRYLLFVSPIVIFWCWIFICISYSESFFWPTRTAVVGIGLSVVIVSQIKNSEIKRVRHCVLVLAALFNLDTLLHFKDVLGPIISGSLHARLGLNVDPGLAVAFPRIMYMLVLTCIFTLIIEKQKWFRIVVAGLMVCPLIIAFASAGRGALAGFVAAVLFLALNQRKKSRFFGVGIIAGMVLFAVYWAIIHFFPLMMGRIEQAESGAGRYDLWLYALDHISLFGSGIGSEYAHNIFLELFQDYGVVGFFLFLPVLTVSLGLAWKTYSNTLDLEILWVMAIIVLQMVAQQFSLNIFTGAVWAALVLPLGLSWDFVEEDVAILPRADGRIGACQTSNIPPP